MNNRAESAKLLELTSDLISRASVTPLDEGCQAMLCDRLKKLSFDIEPFPFEDVSNFWAKRQGQRIDAPVFCFAGHTDVVPPGPLSRWSSPPFEPTLQGDILYGRGAADMKGSLAAMLDATERFIEENPLHAGSIAFLITSDEEGPFINGTTRVVDALMARDERMDYCLVGEPSSTERVGDIIKHGRRGSLSATLDIHGTQGHVAYPHLADNAVHKALKSLHELAHHEWDKGNDDFPPSTLQITSVQAGHAGNVIPGELEVKFNIRFCNLWQSETLKSAITDLLDKEGLSYDITWSLSGEPFLTPKGKLIDAVSRSIEKECGYTPELSTAGGTSDGRFIAKIAREIIELGPVNASIHKVDEQVSLSDLTKLSDIYSDILESLLLD